MLFKQEIDNIPTDFFPDFLPLSEILWDGKTIATKNYTISQCIRLTGVDYQGLSSERLQELHNIRRAFFCDEEVIDNVTMTIFSGRRKISFSATDFVCKNEMALKVANSYLSNFTDGFITEITIVVTMKFGNLISNFTGIASKNYKFEGQKLRGQVSRLDNHSKKIIARLADFLPTLLEHNENGHSALIDFWQYITNTVNFGYTTREKTELNNVLALSDIEFFPNKKCAVFTNTHGIKRYCSFLCLKAYPSETNATILDSLMALRIEMNLVQWFLPQTKDNAKNHIAKFIKKLRSGMMFAEGRIRDLEEVANRIDSENIYFHYHIFLLVVYADNEVSLKENISKIEANLAKNGIFLIKESWNMQACFFSQFPGNEYLLKSRSRQITADNLAQFITFSGSEEGHMKSAFGYGPIAPFSRFDGSLYNFNWHASAADDACGHTFICGASGTGKTTLAMFLIMMSLAKKTQIISTSNPRKNSVVATSSLKALIFDSAKGAKIPCLAFGGTYQTIGEDLKTYLNPMSLPDTAANRMFLQNFLVNLAGGAVNDKEYEVISEIIRQNYQLSFESRRLCELRDIFGLKNFDKTGSSSLAYKLNKWLPEKEGENFTKSNYGLIFNAHRDCLNFNGQIAGFDMSDSLKNPELLAPLASYIFHKFNDFVTTVPTPHIIFIDEAVQYLNNPIFGSQVLKLLREQRKKNGVIVLAGQEPSILTESANGQAALQNIETFIIFPNSAASKNDYINGLNLNDREFDYVKNSYLERSVLIKRKNGSSAVVNIDLSYLDSYLKLFSSSVKNVNALEILMQSNHINWLEEFMSG